MAYIGNIPAEAYISISSQTFTTINGTGYTLSTSVTTSEDIALFLNNVRQKPSTYTASGLVLTMGTATTTADELYCVYLGKALQTVNPPAASVGTSQINDDAVTYAKIQDTTTANRVIGAATAGVVSEVEVATDMIADDAVTIAKTDLISTASAASLTAKGTSGVTDGYITLNCDQNTHGIKLKSPPHSAAQSYTLTFPQTAPATDKYLQTTAAGQLSFATVTEYNDDALQNDIATLALHQATNANAAKYNLTNTNVDVFQDSTGVASFTDCARDATGEFVASVYEGTQAQVAQGAGTIIGDYSANGAVAFDGSGSVGWASSCYKTTMGSGMYIGKDWGSGVTKTISGFKHTSSSDDATLSSTSDCELRLLGHTSDAPASATQLGSLAIDGRTMSTTFTKLTGMTTTTAYRYHWIYIYRTVGTGGNAITSEIEFWETPTTESATGNFVSTATTANASVSKVGIVITYKNNAGTNALNTDIVAQVSADGGSNYTTCVLAAAGTFSTGVLQCVANDVSVTAGTSIQYKISFANQALATKEARITGVSLIY